MRLLRLVWGFVVLVVGLVRRPWRRERIVPEGEPDTRAEGVAIALLLAATACAVMFIVIYAFDWAHQTQYLGLALGLSLGLIAAALILASKRLVVTEELEEEYPPPGEPGEQEQIVQLVEESGSRITRRRLLGGAGAAAGTALGGALLAPVASLGPVLDTEQLYETPWHRGRRLVDDDGKPIPAGDIDHQSFHTAYPEGADPELLASPLIVVRLRPERLRLPPERARWAPEGILAFSKVCTHAGCAVALYRRPLYPKGSSQSALVCPCHYSTFNPATGGTVIFGPAGRNLPQLPLEIDRDGLLRAAGDFSGPVGPSFWGVRTRGPA